MALLVEPPLDGLHKFGAAPTGHCVLGPYVMHGPYGGDAVLWLSWQLAATVVVFLAS